MNDSEKIYREMNISKGVGWWCLIERKTEMERGWERALKKIIGKSRDEDLISVEILW